MIRHTINCSTEDSLRQRLTFLRLFSHFAALWCLTLLFSLVTPLSAAEINLTLNQRSVQNQVTVEVINQSRIALPIQAVEVILDGRHYLDDRTITLTPGGQYQHQFTIDYPTLPGSYPQQVKLRYQNEGQWLTLSDVGFYHFQRQALLNEAATIEADRLQQEGKVTIRASQPAQWQLIYPDELALIQQQPETGSSYLRNPLHGINANYTLFAIQNRVVDGVHYSAVVRGKLSTTAQNNYPRGYLNSPTLILLLLISLTLFVYLSGREERHSHWAAYFARLALATFAYLFLKNGPELFTWLAQQSIRFAFIDPLYPLFTLFRDHLLSSHYRYFFRYFVDAYWLCIALIYPIYHYRSGFRGDLRDDKYSAALQQLITPWRQGLRGRKPAPGTLLPPVKLGLLILAVKLFFLPFLASWVINNVIHQWNLSQNLTWDFHTLNAYLLALFILTDTAIFAVGYAFESERCGSKLRSVEPTLFGWIVCLWCYPPFNQFSFTPFDVDLFPIFIHPPGWTEPYILAAITLCWGIFVWASVALGFKASNLTNRGIVSSGPYRYCRHPAYSAKVTAWLIEGIFLGKFFIGILIAFAVIYFLRGWTEERHLSADPDFLAYKKEVRYRIIPGIF
ncbi:MAG: hypothetical protein HQL49_11445 [Gammaproteobacteria bacterium]|nr:hypothetical protein [Gammaproteobacteria bacterium]